MSVPITNCKSEMTLLCRCQRRLQSNTAHEISTAGTSDGSVFNYISLNVSEQHKSAEKYI